METIGDWDDSWGRFFLYLALMAPFCMAVGVALFGLLWKWVNQLFLAKRRRNR